MGRLLILEPFDMPVAEPLDCGPSEQWEAGHAAGVLAGQASEAARQGVLRNDVAQSVMDITFTYAEARTQVLESLGPLFAGLMDQLLPELARETLLPRILEQVIAAARADSQVPMRILLNPATCSSLQDVLPSDIPLPLSLLEDASLGPGQVLLKHHQTETVLDLDSLVAGVKATFAAYFDEIEGKTRHG